MKKSESIDNHKSFLKNTFWQYGLQAIKYLLPFVTLPYLTRVLEPSGYAIVAYTSSFMVFVQVFIEFGFNLSGTKQIAEARNNSKVMGSIAGSIIQARLILCVLVGLVVGVICTQVQVLSDNPTYALFAYLAMCGWGLAPDYLFQGKELMSPLTIRYLISKGTSTLLIFLLVDGTDKMLLIPIFDILASSIALAWSFIFARHVFCIKITWVPIRRVFQEIKDSSPYFVTKASSSALGGLTTVVIGLAVQSPAEIAYWSLSINIIGAIQQMYSPIVNSLYPHVLHSGNCRFVKKIALVSIPVVLLCVPAVILLSRTILLILGGEAYVDAAPLLSALSPILLFSFYCSLFGWPVLGAMGKVNILARNTLLSAGLNLILLILIAIILPGQIMYFAWARVFSELFLFIEQVCSSWAYLA